MNEIIKKKHANDGSAKTTATIMLHDMMLRDIIEFTKICHALGFTFAKSTEIMKAEFDCMKSIVSEGIEFAKSVDAQKKAGTNSEHN